MCRTVVRTNAVPSLHPPAHPRGLYREDAVRCPFLTPYAVPHRLFRCPSEGAESNLEVEISCSRMARSLQDRDDVSRRQVGFEQFVRDDRAQKWLVYGLVRRRWLTEMTVWWRRSVRKIGPSSLRAQANPDILLYRSWRTARTLNHRRSLYRTPCHSWHRNNTISW